MSAITEFVKKNASSAADSNLEAALTERFGPEHGIVVRNKKTTTTVVMGSIDHRTVPAITFDLALAGKLEAPVQAVLTQHASGAWTLLTLRTTRFWFRRVLSDTKAAALLERSN